VVAAAGALGAAGATAAPLVEQRLAVNGVTLRVVSGGEGTPIVVVHGGPGLGSDYLIPGFRRLADTHRLVFYDQRGCGGSTGDEDPSGLTMESLVADLEGLRAALGFERMTLIGQSFGALVAINYAAAHPDRVVGLLLLEPAPGSSEYLAEFQQRIASRLGDADKAELAALVQSEPFRRRDVAAFRRFMELRLATYYFDRSRFSPNHLASFDAERVRKFFVSSTAFGPYLTDFDVHPLLAKIACPTLVLHGDSDPVPTVACERLRDGIAGARLVVFPDCGHFAHVEAEAPYFEVVSEFLAELPAARE